MLTRSVLSSASNGIMICDYFCSMRSCWKWDPADRPHFWEIHGTLVSLMQPPVQYFEEEEFSEPPVIPSFQTDHVGSGGLI